MGLSFRGVLSVMSIFFLVATLVGCGMKKRNQGAVTGAVLGGAAGEAIDDDGEEGAIAGAVIGGIAGYQIGKSMEKADRRELARGLNNTPPGETYRWTSGNQNYVMKVNDSYTNNLGWSCRDFTLNVYRNNRPSKQMNNTACLNDKGTWKLQDRA